MKLLNSAKPKKEYTLEESTLILQWVRLMCEIELKNESEKKN